VAKIGGGSPSTGYKLLHRIVRLGMSDRVIVSVPPSSLPLVTLFAPPPFCERTPRLQTTPRSQSFSFSRHASVTFLSSLLRTRRPLGVAESPIRDQNNSHLFIRPPRRRNEMSSNAIRYRRVLIPLE